MTRARTDLLANSPGGHVLPRALANDFDAPWSMLC
eukprot:SAG11_NODE_24987_length_365_cov_0.725564_1_plen_34_part_10